MSELNLSGIRTQIDSMDEDIVELLGRRMQLAEQVARYKASHGLPVLDEQRERAVVEDRSALAAAFGLPPEGIGELFELIMRMSRERQQEILEADAAADNGIPRIAAFQGVPGANSHVALIHLLGERMASQAYDTFEQVFAAVESGEAAYGVVPVENSYAGSVAQVYDLLGRYNVHIVGETSLPISHALAVCKGSSLDDITHVYSHEQALAQCRPFFEAHPSIEAHSFYNTAGAAKFVAEQNNPQFAALANSYAAKLYGLDVLEPALEATPDNTTRFLLVAAAPYRGADANKAAVRFTLAHVPGSLATALQHFALCELNMVKIESRPLKDRNFEYVFYVDFEGAGIGPRVHKALAADQTVFADVRVLGVYRMRKRIGGGSGEYLSDRHDGMREDYTGAEAG